MKGLFNKTVLRKDLTRFAPLWCLYTVFAVLVLLLTWDGLGTSAFIMNNAETFFGMMGVVNFFYAGLCALLLFGDLFTPRICNMLHALPLRREGWFLTHVLSGMLFCLLPNLIAALVAATMLGSYAYAVFLWLAMVVMQFLFFFGLGAFAVQCAGNALGAIAVYLITNFLAVVATFLMHVFYEPLLYGITIDTTAIHNLFCPVVAFSQTYIVTYYNDMTGITTITDIPAQPWIYTGVAAGVGALLLVLSVVLYRRRQLESAGDMIAWRPVAPVVLTVYTLVLGGVHFFITGSSTDFLSWFFLFTGLFIGFFTGRMMLEKRVMVFRGKNFLAFGILVAALGLTMGVTAADPAGITRYVPEASQVERVSIAPYASYYGTDRNVCVLTQKEDIEKILQLHRVACVNPAAELEDSTQVCLTYKLRDGRTLYREYRIPDRLDCEPVIHSFYSRPQCVLGTENLESMLKAMDELVFYDYDYNLPQVYIGRNADGWTDSGKSESSTIFAQEHTGSFADNDVARGLMEAVYADCLAGKMSQQAYEKTAVGHLELQVRYGTYYNYLGITVYADCENTIAFLKTINAIQPPL